jgi:oligoribonuclease NrnB/cAMP/cGMP phosphodiesterase (DHH superfamily)
MKKICVYHAGCPDGFGAAWATCRAWEGQGEYVARGHYDCMRGKSVKNALLLFVDIAPNADELRDLADHAAHIVILDHHVTNQQKLEADPELMNALAAEGHQIHFDMKHSGAILSWQHHFPDEQAPPLLRYVEDQDIWNWELPESEAVNAALSSYPHDFEVWNDLANREISSLIAEGQPIVRNNAMEVSRSLNKASTISIGTRRVEAVNARTRRSAIGHALAERRVHGEEWGCVYYIVGSQVEATLYSIDEFDVSKIAGEWGGGGHRNAAGFTISLEDWLRNFA